MSPRDSEIWEAAKRTAAQAPNLTPGDDLYLQLRPLLAGWLKQSPDQQRDAA